MRKSAAIHFAEPVRRSVQEKEALKRELVNLLSSSPEVQKLVIFGSFPTSEAPNDIDLAVFQNSQEAYLPLAMRYRRLTRSVAEKIPLDIIPLRPDPVGSFMEEINRGEVIYER